MAGTGVSIRDARPDDHDAVIDLCEGIWEDRDGDYLPRVYPEWIEGDDRRTLVAVRDGDLVGIAQAVLLTRTESWYQGLRVREDARNAGIANAVVGELFDWARDEGSLVARAMVFSWNTAGMGVSRSIGFEPTTAVRFARLEPTAGTLPASVVRDGDVAWQAWTTSRTRAVLGGLALDDEESWAMRELRRADLEDGRVVAVVEDGIAGMAVRGRSYETTWEEEPRTEQEYAALAWRDSTTVDTLLQAIRVDAADQGATSARIVVPEDPSLVTDLGAVGPDVAGEPHFVFSADLVAVAR